MTKSSIFIFLFFAVRLLSFGQTQTLILTKAQNDKWLDSLNTLSLDNKLKSIRNRVLSDTNVFVKKYHADKIRVVDSLGNRVYGDGKPTLIISGHPIYIDNKTKSIRIIELSDLMTATYIREINILNPKDPATLSLYGSSGQFGIIIITPAKKEYTRKFKRLSQNFNH